MTAPIPEDLRDEHRKMYEYSSLDYGQVSVPPERVMQLIERIAALETQNLKLRLLADEAAQLHAMNAQVLAWMARLIEIGFISKPK